MTIQPILATLRKHKLTVVLLMLQVALTCAIVCNVAFMIANRAAQMLLPSGLAENELTMLDSTSLDPHENLEASHKSDLAALRGIAGVNSVVAVNSLPLNRNQYGHGACADKATMQRAMAARAMVAGCIEFSAYSGTPGELQTLGLHLVAGRDFRADEYVADDNVPVVIISQALAARFYPGAQAVGQILYTGPNRSARVIGVVDTLLAPSLGEPEANHLTMLWPQRPNIRTVTYVLRSAPGDRLRVLKDAQDVLTQLNPQRLIPSRYAETYTQMRAEYFRRDSTMISLLLAAALGLLFVTALGIAGLASFWVQQRTRSIGIRRAIGATRGDILRYFQTENFLIVSAGVVLGVALAVLLNLVLMKHYELPRLPLYYLPIGALALWLLGQLAVLSPALRAATVAPVVATRSV